MTHKNQFRYRNCCFLEHGQSGERQKAAVPIGETAAYLLDKWIFTETQSVYRPCI
jgi:hypothetical protein